jgi:cytochrome c oxidase subunit 2
MGVAIVLFVIVAGSVLFHLASPWWLTPLASNWQQMDDTLSITIAVTGLFFVVINLFVVYTLWRFRHRAGARAAYEPEKPRLERWLIAVTTLGIIGLLAPGLAVYARFVDPPADALTLEVLGQQWQWRYRFPGDDGQLGRSDVRFMSAENPFGLDPRDPRAQDDRLVMGSEVHLPQRHAVKVLLRSRDTLHDFFVPQFRARMNIVPGQVSWFWFTPVQAGRYESMCAQLCGIGHARMQGLVVVEDDATFRDWLRQLPTFAMSLQAATPDGADPLAPRGRALAQAKGCAGCHTTDGGPGVGPTWKGLYGKTETMADNSTARVDDRYLRDFIRNPASRDIKGFAQVMPTLPLSDEELDALVAYIKSLAAAPQGTTQR